MSRIVDIWKGEEGFGLVAATFILVFLAVSGAVIWRVNSVQSITSTQGLVGAKVLFAAKSGIQWAIYQIAQDRSCAAFPAAFAFAEAGLQGMDVAVTCTPTAVQDNSAPYNVYTVVATATYGAYPSRDFTRRLVQATIVDR